MSRALVPEWMEDAVCASIDPELWFPPRGGNPSPAKKICDTCPVQAECLEYGAAEPVGIWGGLSARDRLRAPRSAA